ncbi:M50 family metallopeptidase [Ornithinimicrobium cerasi]|uniref:Membrane-associated protease RseP, regulator of RpoE activity n=1 Tax=Ornithinimicrobium cerasi TaxID=2248773 RepID=A0A285VMD2_9MICO|nr:Membrane-associated protease RseP, regulator of RpoE activity [Ornithinimicrobium cerasi]
MILYLLGVLVIAVGIAVSIALHEVGHLVPAKRFGVKVPQYMVGFGPTLWSTRRGETEYGLKAVPLGGYVRMIGMFPPRAQDGGRLRRATSNPFHQMVEQARQDSLDEVGPGEEHRVFYRLPVWQRLVVMAGGPVMNLLICTALITLILTVHGVGNNTSTVSAVAECANTDVSDADCAGQPPSPAREAGLQVGDTIVSVDGTAVADWSGTTYAIQNAGEQAVFVIERDGERRSLTADLVMRERPLMNADGTLQLDGAGDPVWGQAGFLGASPTFVYEPQPVSAVPGVVGEMFTGTARIILTLPQRMVDVAQAAFGTEERDVDGPMSVVGVGRVAGEVASEGVLGVADTVAERFWIVLSLIASLNMALFVFNLIPLLPLDGGHIAGALWEGLKKAWARVRGLPVPGPVDTAKALPVAYAVAVGLLGMTALLIYADIVKPISLG